MRHGVRLTVKILAVMCLLACGSVNVFAQDEGDLMAKRRIFPNAGPGLRAVKRGGEGRLYVLGSPSPGLLVFDAAGKQVLSISELPAAATSAKAGRALITFGEDCDADADGKIYVADRGANLVQVFSADGALLRSIPVNAPVAVAALPDGEVAVGTLREPHLVIVFDKNGRDVREFGEPEPLTEREDLNRYLNIGQLATAAAIRPCGLRAPGYSVHRAGGHAHGASGPQGDRAPGTPRQPARAQANHHRDGRGPGKRGSLDRAEQHVAAF
jgi:hypothetical protein